MQVDQEGRRTMTFHIRSGGGPKWVAERAPVTIVEAALVLAAVTTALVLVGGARGQGTALGGAVGVTLGQVSVGDGTATVSGSVGPGVGADAKLAINGRPVVGD